MCVGVSVCLSVCVEVLFPAVHVMHVFAGVRAGPVGPSKLGPGRKRSRQESPPAQEAQEAVNGGGHPAGSSRKLKLKLGTSKVRLTSATQTEHGLQ